MQGPHICTLCGHILAWLLCYQRTAVTMWFSYLCSQFEGGLGRAQRGAACALREFVPAAAELSRQREAAQYGPRHQISLVRTALRMGRQVSRWRH